MLAACVTNHKTSTTSEGRKCSADTIHRNSCVLSFLEEPESCGPFKLTHVCTCKRVSKAQSVTESVTEVNQEMNSSRQLAK